ncbi:hypothetical protein M9Q43_13095 [Flavobacterium sp. HXWNR29]|uniref:hypothetical protein n=1 Tax=Flavobacterium odoriferum TaxID=2946604 RepID=UPI0021CB9973|nr:hypothetical protein [Flavobacterium sp. HXWNR29]MCU4190092.1 hypothetical protein [Flavobacterium sp. HXWNR29]
MKKIVGLLLFILVNSSCSSEFKSINRKVSRIENEIAKKAEINQNLCFNCSPEINTLVYFTKIENQIKRINYKIDSNVNCKEYTKDFAIFLDNNVPILITEITTGICEYEMSGVNKKTNKFESFKQESKISNNVKIYINDWENFEITVIGGNKSDYNLETKEKYQKIINEVLRQGK